MDKSRVEYRKKYYAEHKEALDKVNNAWEKAHPDRVKAYKKKYIESHREQYNKRMREYMRKYRANKKEQNGQTQTSI